MAFIVDYFLCISIAGTVVLLVFSIMGYCNVENFHIPKGKHKDSGLLAAVGSGIYLLLTMVLIVIKIRKEKIEKNQENRQRELEDQGRKSVSRVDSEDRRAIFEMD